MFVSTYPLKLDEKGRFFIPPKFRAQLLDGVVVFKSFEHCLAVYPTATFEAELAEQGELDYTLKNVRGYLRMRAADAYETQPDKQGRISLPVALRQYAKLDKDLVVSGAVKHFEIWSPDNWAAYRAAEEDRLAEMDGLVLAPRASTT